MQDRRIPCRVCGKLFIPCNKSSAAIGAFNYREMCCSPECGEQYLHDVMKARGLLEAEDTAANVQDNTTEATEIFADNFGDTDSITTKEAYSINYNKQTVAEPRFRPDNYIKHKKKH